MVEKILNCSGLGVSGRQNEMIELALTHKFDSVEIDMADLLGRHGALGKEFACQFLQSAKMKIGTFQLPIDFCADEATYKQQAETVDTMLELAEELQGSRCYVRINPTHEELSFQENFERHCTRLSGVATKFAAKNIKIGLLLQASPDLQKHDFKFVQTAEEILSLVKTVNQPNVGICLDTWNWIIGQGAKDQLGELTNDQIIEVRLADVPEDADPASIKQNQMVMAGESSTSIAVDVLKHLGAINYDGAISALTSSSMLGGRSKNAVVGNIARQLKMLMIQAGLIEGDLEEDSEEAETAEGDAKTDANADGKGEKAGEEKKDASEKAVAAKS